MNKGTLAEHYARLVQTCLQTGHHTVPRGKQNLELRPVILHTEGREVFFPELQLKSVNYRFAIAELMAYVCGWNDVAWLARFSPNVAQFSDDGRTFNGAYGWRLRHSHGLDQLSWAIHQLAKDPYTRQVVLDIWHPSFDAAVGGTKDVVCNTHIYLKLRGDALDMTVFRRSADAIWGVPYDHFTLCGLLCVLASAMETKVGTLVQFIDSFHVYTPDAGYYSRERVDAARECPEAPRLHCWDYLWLEGLTLDEIRAEFEKARWHVEEGTQVGRLSTYLLGGKRPCS